MSDPTHVETNSQDDESLASILAGLKPMGDLTKFAIKDLGPDEEEAFFAILKNA